MGMTTSSKVVLNSSKNKTLREKVTATNKLNFYKHFRPCFHYSVFVCLRFQITPFSYFPEPFPLLRPTPFSPRGPGTKTKVFPLLRFRPFSYPLFELE